MTTANFSWVGVAPYTPPAGNVANFAWSVSHTSGGWASTHFGTPKSRYNQSGVATGIGAAQTGFPTGRYAQIANPPSIRSTRFGSLNGSIWQPATGFSSTLLGAPASIRGYGPKGWLATKISQPQLLMTAKGWSSTALSTPTGAVFYSATAIGPTSVVPQAYYPFNQEGDATGEISGGLGTPVTVATAPGSTARRTQAFGARATVVATPYAAFLQLCPVAGMHSVAFGAPSTVRGGRTTGGTTTRLGSAKATVAAHPNSWQATRFGTSVLRWKLQETGRSTTKFGSPKGVRPRARQAFPVPARRAFGQATATRIFPHRATGYQLTHVGGPKAVDTHHALHTPPTVRWGAGLLHRST